VARGGRAYALGKARSAILLNLRAEAGRLDAFLEAVGSRDLLPQRVLGTSSLLVRKARCLCAPLMSAAVAAVPRLVAVPMLPSAGAGATLGGTGAGLGSLGLLDEDDEPLAAGKSPQLCFGLGSAPLGLIGEGLLGRAGGHPSQEIEGGASVVAGCVPATADATACWELETVDGEPPEQAEASSEGGFVDSKGSCSPSCWLACTGRPGRSAPLRACPAGRGGGPSGRGTAHTEAGMTGPGGSGGTSCTLSKLSAFRGELRTEGAATAADAVADSSPLSGGESKLPVRAAEVGSACGGELLLFDPGC